MSSSIVNKEPVRRKEIVSFDPATGDELARVQQSKPDEIIATVRLARAAQPDWAKLSFRERQRVILNTREILLTERKEIAQLIARETGKPISEALSTEVVPTLDAMHYFAYHTHKLLRPQKIDIGQLRFMGRSSSIVYKPIGVVGIISPWNFPLATPAQETVMALMAGNAVVLKPSELTTLTALKFVEFYKRAGLPEGLLNILIGDGSVGSALIDAQVDKIMFTGSVATGKRVAEAAAKHLTPVVLELGGKDPMIVLEDANLENAARAAVWGAFANAGQACASIERCYVHEKVATAFIEQVLNQTRTLKQGNGLEYEIDVGAMSTERQLEIVEAHVDEAKSRGAKALTGGSRLEIKGLFYPPTVLTGVTRDMKVMRDETFGPVLPILTFSNETEAIKLANDSPFGLTASVWTTNVARGRTIAEQLEAGTVMVNEVLYTHGIAQTPWGGVKDSGYGRTHGRMGILELVRPQHIHVSRFSFLPDVWWFPYSSKASRLFDGFALHFTRGSILRTSRLLPQILRRIIEVKRSTKI